MFTPTFKLKKYCATKRASSLPPTSDSEILRRAIGSVVNSVDGDPAISVFEAYQPLSQTSNSIRAKCNIFLLRFNGRLHFGNDVQPRKLRFDRK